MIQVSNVSLKFGERTLFENVNVKFTPGNCYGLIGANGSGKSTFLKILSGDVEQSTGEISIPGNLRMATLKQDHFAFDDFPVLETVIMGHTDLYKVMKEKDEIYSKEDFSDEDGIRASELEEHFNELNGWEAESEAAQLLSDLGIEESRQSLLMKDLEGGEKVRVLLAQALFGYPDILLLDEPTNHLDRNSIMWLEDFLADFKNTVIVVSHDRHFLDQVCTHIADIDYGKIQLYTGNYSFWRQSSELALRQQGDRNKKAEEKRKELQEFIARFSANASKSRQATARKKLLEKITIDEIKPSSRKYPAIHFQPERDLGDQILQVTDLALDDEENNPLFQSVNFNIEKDQKVVFIAENHLALTGLFECLVEKVKPKDGIVKWGQTVKFSYFRKEHAATFDQDINLLEWLAPFSVEKDEKTLRTWLGRMLFVGDSVLKKVNVLSGGEKVRCLFASMMCQSPNFLIFDEPTNHLDLESITALNESLIKFKGCILFTSHDHTFIQTIANRIIEISPNGNKDYLKSYDEYLEQKKKQSQKALT